jgi:hypothetical protein
MFILPPRDGQTGIQYDYSDFEKLVILGANGSGKTRFSVWIEENVRDLPVHRISAQKSLSMPISVQPSALDIAKEEFLYGVTTDNKEWLKTYGKIGNRWGNNPTTFLLNDYEKLLKLLHTEEYETSVRFKDEYVNGVGTIKPVTKLDMIIDAWSQVLPHRILKKEAGKIEVYPIGDLSEGYNASEMSDGERLVFYFLGEILCAPENGIVIIDEPENHLHKSIIVRLWNIIESLRTDCKFIYLTHDINFAISRINSKLIWLKSYEGKNVWNYQEVEDIESIPTDIYLEILGSRQPILFVEGERSSYDFYVYQHLFADQAVIPIGNCDRVISATKAFSELDSLHHLSAKGIIDRDRRSQEEIDSYSTCHVYAPQVAEIENLFLIENVVKHVAVLQRKQADEVFSSVKDRVLETFERNLDRQVYEYTIYRIKDSLTQKMNGKFANLEEFGSAMECIYSNDKANEIYRTLYTQFKEYASQRDYDKVLKVLNYKGLIAQSRVAEQCGLVPKSYITFIKQVLNENSVDGEQMRQSMRDYIPIST